MKNILEEASEITSQDRNIDYDAPEDNFERIWQYNRAYLINKASLFSKEHLDIVLKFIDSLGKEYVARQGLFIKLGREDFKHKRDNLTDGCGYLR